MIVLRTPHSAKCPRQELESEALSPLPESLPRDGYRRRPPVPADQPDVRRWPDLVAAFAGGNLISTVLGAAGEVLQAR